jgi:hypothetical protein
MPEDPQKPPHFPGDVMPPIDDGSEPQASPSAPRPRGAPLSAIAGLLLLGALTLALVVTIGGALGRPSAPPVIATPSPPTSPAIVIPPSLSSTPSPTIAPSTSPSAS